MANLFRLTRDVRGNWRRQNLGVKPSPNGDLVKPTFTLGRDYGEACKRVVFLEQMWTAVGKDWQDGKPTACPIWNQETYNIALAVARGESPIYLDVPQEERDTAAQYPDSDTVLAVWIGSLRELFPFLDLRIAGADNAVAEKASEDMAVNLDKQAQKLKDTARHMRGFATGETLHPALDSYTSYLLARYGTSGYGRTQTNQVKMLKSQLENQPLAMLTADRIEAILALFANRPLSKHNGNPLAFFTCRNVLITFRQFLRWLNRSETFQWEMPRSFTFPSTRIKKGAADRVQKRKTFTREELKTIWRYALPWDRALILLALNCGFSKAEIATLQAADVQNDRKRHTFVKRARVKTEAYGEWVLWPETLAALAYLKTLHRGGTPYMVTSKTGKPLDKPTRGGNENQTIKNHWDRLLKRVRADYPVFLKLPFKHLRKTGASIVRKLAPRRATELASMYLAHGQKADSGDQLLPAYTDRPWRKLHKVLLKMRRILAPVFDTVKDPWKGGAHRVSPLLVERIMAMRAKGRTFKEIGAAVGLHEMTVGRYCRQEEAQGTNSGGRDA